METEKITSHQLFALTGLISLGGSIIVSSSTVAAVARRDAWLTGLITIALGIPVVLLYYYLGSRNPGMTLIGILKKVFGKWLGFTVSVAYVALFITTSMRVPWYIGNFFGRIMHETPFYIIEVLFITGIVIAVLYGIEVIARASEMFLFFISVFFVIFIVLTFKDIKIEYITPVLEYGLYPAVKGSWFLSTYITFTLINMLMIFPRYTNDMPQAKRAIIKGFLWSGSISFVTITVTILVLGYALTERLSLPTLVLAKNINIGDVLTRLEYVLSIIWLVSEFIVSVAFFFSGLTALSELIGLKDHKSILLPYGLIVLVMSGVIFPNPVYQGDWVNTVYTPLITTFGLIIPLVTAIVYLVRKKTINTQS